MLRKACKRLVGRLSWKQSHCKETSTATAAAAAESVAHAAASGALQLGSESDLSSVTVERSNGRSESPEADVPVQSHPSDLEHCANRVFVPPAHFEDWSSPFLHIHHPESGRSSSSSSGLMMRTVVRNPSSESDSGVCLDDAELRMAEEEEEDEEEDEEEEDEEGEWECNCDECFFAQCEEELDDWRISAKDLSLDKVVGREDGEVVYR